MLTDLIPRLVRGRIYHIKHAYLTSSWESLGIFMGVIKRVNPFRNLYDFVAIALKENEILWPSLLISANLISTKEYTITRVPQEDLFIYAGYEAHTDLYKELLADPSINLKVKLTLKSRVAKALRGQGRHGRIQ